MNKRSMISGLFWIGGIYDGILGLTFVFFPLLIFQRFQIEPPNHDGYVQFPAALLIIFALMFFAVARNPEKNRNLVLYGILLKISYCSMVIGYWIGPGIPWIWKPFAICDLIFGALFLWAMLNIEPEQGTACKV